MSQDYNWSNPNATPDEDHQQPENQPSPDQTSMFAQEETTASVEPARMDIPHKQHVSEPVGEDTPLTTLYSDSAVSETTEPEPVPSQPDVPVHEEDEVSNTTKVKIIAAIAIVLTAGYVAYWVQEPVQLKADVISETSDKSSTDLPTEPKSDLLADSDADAGTVPGTSVNVDVSLFGFEPSTLKIDKDTIVVWTNTSTEDQTIIGSSDDGQSFVSPVLSSGNTFNYKFEQDATFTYYSTYNPALKATIIVGLGKKGPAVDPATVKEGSATLVEDPDSPATDSPKAPVLESSDTAKAAGANGTVEAASAKDAQITVPGDGEESPEIAPSQDSDALHAAADTNSPDNLAKTGPTEVIYLIALFVIAWFNRKKLYKVFSKS